MRYKTNLECYDNPFDDAIVDENEWQEALEQGLIAFDEDGMVVYLEKKIEEEYMSEFNDEFDELITD